MSKSNNYETSILALLFNGTPIANIADNAASAPLTELYGSLHTADPGEAGTQSTNECTYTGYTRVAINRNSGGFTVSGNTVTPVSPISFPTATAGTETATHFSIGSLAAGAGSVYYKGTITPNISIGPSVTPVLTTATNITED